MRRLHLPLFKMWSEVLSKQATLRCASLTTITHLALSLYTKRYSATQVKPQLPLWSAGRWRRIYGKERSWRMVCIYPQIIYRRKHLTDSPMREIERFLHPESSRNPSPSKSTAAVPATPHHLALPPAEPHPSFGNVDYEVEEVPEEVLNYWRRHDFLCLLDIWQDCEAMTFCHCFSYSMARWLVLFLV